MPYTERTVTFSDGQVEVKRYYAPGQCRGARAQKSKNTKKAAAEVNRRNAVEKLSWLLQENFKVDDWHFSPTFAPNCMPPDEATAKKLFQDTFLTPVRRLYKKLGAECKYIWTIGTSSRGRLHIHLVLNHIDGLEFHQLKKLWKYGQLRVCNTLYADGRYKDLAAYLIDQSKPSGKCEKGQKKYCCSKNLQMPEIQKRIIKRGFWRKEKPGIPDYFRGKYTIDINSIENYVRDFDGTPVQKFILIPKKE